MKAFKTLGSKRGKGKRGFTLIELLIVMVILAILAGVVVMAVGGIFGQAKSRAYDTIKPQIQNGVTAYSTDHNGELPQNVQEDLAFRYTVTTEAGEAIDDCYIFDICQITGSDQLLRQVPDGCYSGADFENNFLAGGCSPTGATHSYIWVVDGTGNVYSMCVIEVDGVPTLDQNDGFHAEDPYGKDYWP